MALHCAATVIVRRPAAALSQVEVLRDRRLAALYAVRPAAADVQEISARLDLAVGDIELEPGEGWGFAHLNEAVLQGISDTHRGETVLVLVSDSHPAQPIEIEIGDDGIAIRNP